MARARPVGRTERIARPGSTGPGSVLSAAEVVRWSRGGGRPYAARAPRGRNRGDAPSFRQQASRPGARWRRVRATARRPPGSARCRCMHRRAFPPRGRRRGDGSRARCGSRRPAYRGDGFPAHCGSRLHAWRGDGRRGRRRERGRRVRRRQRRGRVGHGESDRRARRPERRGGRLAACPAPAARRDAGTDARVPRPASLQGAGSRARVRPGAATANRTQRRVDDVQCACIILRTGCPGGKSGERRIACRGNPYRRSRAAVRCGVGR